MTKVISVVNSKGGVGKTTVAWALATLWSNEKRHILLVDTDQQATLMQLFAVREFKWNIEAAAVSPASLERRIEREIASGDHDFILIDTPGKLESLKPSLGVADLVLMPVQPSGADYFAFRRIIDAMGPLEVPILVVPNRIKTDVQATDIGPAILALSGGRAIVAPTQIGDRVNHSKFLMQGLSLVDVEPMTSVGAQEVAALARYIEELSNGEAKAATA